MRNPFSSSPAQTLKRLAMIAGVVVLSGIGVTAVSAAAGQILKTQTSDGGSTFYIGRCFRMDIRAQTDNLNANSIDVIIPYNTSFLAPYTNSGCTLSATQVVTDGVFPSYPSNSISAGRIELTAYDPSGSSPVNTGVNPADKVIAHVYWKVLAASGAYKIPFQFTAGSTVDTNMAEDDGDGTDVLDAVENVTVNLSVDNTIPTFTSISPSNGAANVSVTDDLSYIFSDAGAGVNTGTLTTRMNGTSYAVTTSGCVFTNTNRIPSCNAAVTLPTLSYNTTYRVSATGADLASPTANTGSTFWTFTTEDDDDAPYVENLNPASAATSVAINSNIVLRIKDYKNNAGVTPGLGVDLSTVEVRVTVSGNTTTYQNGDAGVTVTGTSDNYQITINPASDFPQNATVSVAVDASDLHSPANAMSTYTYSFSTSDTTAPTIDSEDPARYATNATIDDTISFRIKDTGAGVDLDSLQIVLIGTGSAFTASPLRLNSGSNIVSITGTGANYLVTITLPANIQTNTPYSIMIDVSDLDDTDMDTVAYTFMHLVSTGGSTSTNSCTPSPGRDDGQGGGGRRAVDREVQIIPTEQLPTIIERKIIEQLNRRIGGRNLTDDEANRVEQCLDEVLRGAAPKTPYLDIKAGEWYEDAVVWLMGKDALDTTQSYFRGGDNALRAEFAKLLVALEGKPETPPATPSFIDTPADQWFYSYVENAAMKGWMLGNNKCFGTKPCEATPLKSTTRAEAVTMIVRYYELKKMGKAAAFKDVEDTAWYANDIAIAADHCVVQGDAITGLAAPARQISRAEMATMLWRAESNLLYGKDCGTMTISMDDHALTLSPLAASLFASISELGEEIPTETTSPEPDSALTASLLSTAKNSFSVLALVFILAGAASLAYIGRLVALKEEAQKGEKHDFDTKQ